MTLWMGTSGGLGFLVYKWWVDWGLLDGPWWAIVVSLFGVWLLSSAVCAGFYAASTWIMLIIKRLLGSVVPALKNPVLAMWIKSVTAMFLILGFHFDLLAS